MGESSAVSPSGSLQPQPPLPLRVLACQQLFGIGFDLSSCVDGNSHLVFSSHGVSLIASLHFSSCVAACGEEMVLQSPVHPVLGQPPLPPLRPRLLRSSLTLVQAVPLLLLLELPCSLPTSSCIDTPQTRPPSRSLDLLDDDLVLHLMPSLNCLALPFHLCWSRLPLVLLMPSLRPLALLDVLLHELLLCRPRCHQSEEEGVPLPPLPRTGGRPRSHLVPQPSSGFEGWQKSRNGWVAPQKVPALITR